MLERPWSCVAGVALLMLLSGCASPDVEVSTTFDPLSRFPERATYVWDEAQSSLPDDPRIGTPETAELLEEVANREFAARGYQVTDSRGADYRLSYQFVVHNWFGPDNSRSLGSLSLLLVENASNRRVWMGFGRAEILVGLTREERSARLREGLMRMLKDFPPQQRGGRK